MKKVIFVLFAAVIFLACNDAENKISASSSSPTADSIANKDESDDWVPVDSATAMRTMMEAGTPGEQHAMLAKWNGTWTGETTMWMAPDAQPMKATSTAVNKMVMGGRYQQTSFKGDFMGQPFEGISTTGYDNAKKVYFSTWMDNMSTAVVHMEGTWDETSKSITYTGKMICPANGKEAEIKEVYKIIDDKTHVMEMYGPDMQTGKSFKNMEIKFTRKG